MRGNSPSRRAPIRWILRNFRIKLNECLKQQVENSMYEFQTVIHSFQTWKKLTNWNENESNISHKEITYWKKQWHKNLCFERQFFLCNFIHSTNIRSYLQWRASALEGFPNFPTNSLSPYRECIYTTSVLRLFSKTNLKIVSSHIHTLIV